MIQKVLPLNTSIFWYMHEISLHLSEFYEAIFDDYNKRTKKMYEIGRFSSGIHSRENLESNTILLFVRMEQYFNSMMMVIQ